MLVPHHLLFFFKITNDLLETLLEPLNFLLITGYLLRLNYCSLRVLLLSSCVDVDLSLKSHIRILDSCDQLLLFVDFLPLQDRLNRKFLIFQVDLTFNLVNKLIRVRIRHFFQIIQLFVFDEKILGYPNVKVFSFILSNPRMRLYFIFTIWALIFIFNLIPSSSMQMIEKFTNE